MSNNRKLGALWKKERFRTFMRWFFYSLALLIFYMVMSGGFFRGWQPILIVPLAVAVAMHESELSAALFGAVCGLVIDVACGKLFGFSGMWLMPGCLAAALLVSHLIKVNLLNYIWVNASVCAIMALTDYFFRYVLWNTSNADYVLTHSIIPSYVSAAVISPLLFFGVKYISRRLAPYRHYRPTGDNNSDEE